MEQLLNFWISGSLFIAEVVFIFMDLWLVADVLVAEALY